MSLINDALRRASQTEKDRPRQTSTASGMEPAPVTKSSRLTVILAASVVVALLLAGWFFWQWWQARNSAGTNDVFGTAHVVSPATPRVIPPPVAPKPVPVAPIAQKPAPTPAPVAAPAPVAVVPATPVAATPAVTPPGLPNVASYTPTPWPVDLKLGGIFYNKTSPQALINGNIYKVGDNIQGVIIKIIEPDKVTVEWDGRKRVLTMGGS